MEELITLQFGQCGNQLGYALFDVLSNETISNGTHHQFFRSSSINHDHQNECHIARSVLIDMEPKVIHQCHENARASRNMWKYDESQSFACQSGSGNNWAYGYNLHGRRNMDAILELIRKEVEYCDWFGGFLALQSVAGGTGSGVGTFITEQLQDLYPSSSLINTVIWPYSSGEVIVQNYNTLLTMACLTEVSDAILFFENDVANIICQQLLNLPSPSFFEMNQVIARHLAMILLPSSSATQSHHHVTHLMEHLVSHPAYKMLNVKMIPQMSQKSKAFSTHRWSGLMKHLYQMHIANRGFEEGIDWKVRVDMSKKSDTKKKTSSFNHAVANALFVRGTGGREEISTMTEFLDPRLYPSWRTDPLLVCYNSCIFNKYDKSVALLSNSQSILKPFESMSKKAYNMYSSNAFLHQYTANGVQREFFDDAFIKIDQIVKNYDGLSASY